MRLDVYFHLPDLETIVDRITGGIAALLGQSEERLMATIEEVRAIAIANRDAAQSANTRLDAVNTKIDDLRAQVTAGTPVTQEQLDELATLTSETRAALAGISADLDDAEAS